METVLTLSLGGLPPLSARGCEQTLKPIQLGQMKRTVNGELIHVGSQQLKYKSIVKAKDRTVLALNGLAPGVVVSVGCVQPLWEKVEKIDNHYDLMRKPVENSVCVFDENQKKVDFELDGQVLAINKIFDDYPIFVSYRPYLEMRVVDFLIKTNEWTFESSWELFLEEI